MDRSLWKHWGRIVALGLFVSVLIGAAKLGAVGVDSAAAGNGTADDILAYNRGSTSSPFYGW